VDPHDLRRQLQAVLDDPDHALERHQQADARQARAQLGVGAAPDRPSVGATLFQAAIDGGARAVGRATGRIEAGARADLVVLDPDHPALIGHSGDTLLDSFVFAGNTSPIRDVMAGGRWRVRDGRHADEAAVAARYRTVMAALLG